MLIMAISGGAIIPPLYGRLVDNGKEVLIGRGLEAAEALAMAAKDGYYMLIPCYVVILVFALWGHSLKKRQ